MQKHKNLLGVLWYSSELLLTATIEPRTSVFLVQIGHLICCGPSLNLQLVLEFWGGAGCIINNDVTQSCDPPFSAVTTCIIESFVYDLPESGFVLMTGKELLLVGA